MEHVALYRKYRPQKFSDVVEQEHIVGVLEKSIANEKVGHAYLFSGGRGTGKTTVARLFARALGTHDEDIYEMDAASNRGIDDIRELRESVRTLPFSSPYKVYILDEVHMLTKESWGALLKTLEEPPKHVIFILATTDPEKVPDTIISRCEVYAFRAPTEETLASFVTTIAKKEKMKLDSGVAELVALAGDRSYRDSIGILQKLLNASDSSSVSLELAESVIGAPSTLLVRTICEALFAKDLSASLEALRELEKGDKDVLLFFKRFLLMFRAILFLRYGKGEKTPFALSDDDLVCAKKMAQAEGKVFSSSSLVRLLDAYQPTLRSPVPLLPLELAFMDILAPEE